MSKEGNKTVIQFEESDAQHVFTDIIQVVLSGDTVVLDIAIRSKKEEEPAKVSHTIHMTVPHFLRVTEVFKELSDKINEQIESQTK